MAFVPDLKAPRYRPVRLSTLSRPIIRKMKVDHPSLRKLSDQAIDEIIRTFNQTLYEQVLENRDGVELPARLGFLFIGSCPRKVEANVDWKKSAEYLQRIQHRNWESDNYFCKIFYVNENSRYEFKNHDLWSFEPGREFSRSLSSHYPQNWKMYVQMDHTLRASRLFRNDSYKQYREKKLQQSLETYNELDI